jgi:hypothetical protein
MITVTCTCGETYHADEKHAGGHVRCRCGKVLEFIAPPPTAVRSGQGSAVQWDTQPKTQSQAGPLRRTSIAKMRRWLLTGSIAGMILLLGVSYWLGDPPQATNPNVPIARSPSPVPAANLNPAPPTCPVETQRRPPSGAELGGRHRGGLGRLRATNGTNWDAVAVLVHEQTERPLRAIFIRHGESGSMTSIPPGRYRIRFQLGTDWLTERRFCEPRATSEFDSVFDFDETDSTTGTSYATYEITLHGVLLGTARTHSIPNSRFELPPP